MTYITSEEEAFAEGFVGVGRDDLAAMPDAELAQWQAGWKAGTTKHILAEKEWARRLTMRQLHEQFKLEERVARVNRWWGIGASIIGVIGTLGGVWLGVVLASSPPWAGGLKAAVAPVANTTQATGAVGASAVPMPSKPPGGP